MRSLKSFVFGWGWLVALIVGVWTQSTKAKAIREACFRVLDQQTKVSASAQQDTRWAAAR